MLFLCIAFTPVNAGIAQSSPNIRVLLQRNLDTVKYTVTTPVFLEQEDERLALVKKGNELIFVIQDDLINLTIQRNIFSGRVFSLCPEEDTIPIPFNGRNYPGRISVRIDRIKLIVTNDVSVEEYLPGVLLPEMGNTSDQSLFSAMKAFAITARTYAIKRIEEKKDAFDIESTTADQVYTGVTNNVLLSQSVKETAGQVLKYEDSLCAIYYHSCCGGKTEDAVNVFGRRAFPYLVSIEDGDPAYCRNAPVFQWKEEYTTDQFLSFLRNAKLIKDDTEIVAIQIPETFPSGRAAAVQVFLFSGDTIIIPSSKIRSTIRRTSGQMLRSTLIDIEFDFENEQVTINGFGNGHGVGLCQFGCMAMSRAGASVEEILSHYFPETEIAEYSDE